MRAWIANTDYEWYRFLSGRPDLDEVNFWRPSSGPFRALSAGEPLLFRLKAPHNKIAGVGFFVHFSVLPANLAWAAFEAKNGAASEAEMRARIEKYRDEDEAGVDYKIGCIILAEPAFFPEPDWIDQPRDWGPTTQVGRREDLTQGEGQRIWHDVMDTCTVAASLSRRRKNGTVRRWRFGRVWTGRVRCPRDGHISASMRRYRRANAARPAGGAHPPVRRRGSHAVRNGLLLRSDLHTLFDRG